MESKHSRNSVLPGASDIKDGLVKMILYSNLCSVEINGVSVKSKSVLRLTSAAFIGTVSSKSVQKDVDNCFKTNSLSEKQKEFVERIFKEAEENDFIVHIGGKVIKSPLRYPGGKSRAVDLILKIIPDFKEYREPFLGSGSTFICLKQIFHDKSFWVNDLYDELYEFWQYSQKDMNRLVGKIYE